MQNSFLNSYSHDHFEIQCTLSFKKHHLAQWWCSVLDVEHTWSVHGNGMVMYIAQQIDSELYQCGQLNPKPDIWARKNCREAKYPSSVGKLPFAVIGTWPWNRAWCLEENNSVFTNVSWWQLFVNNTPVSESASVCGTLMKLESCTSCGFNPLILHLLCLNLTIALTVMGFMSTALMWDLTLCVHTLKLLLLLSYESSPHVVLRMFWQFHKHLQMQGD